MNKIFKIIWSKARNCYVVVSEIAHCRGKGQGQKRAVFTCSLAAALAVFTLTGGIVSVQAAQTINITEENPGAQDSTNQGKYSIVIGPGAKNESNQSDGLIVIGHSATVSNNGTPKDSIAIGTNANVVGENNIAIGTNAAVTNNGGNNAISLGTEAKAEKSESIAIGMNAHANNNDGIAAIAIGSGSEAQKDKSIAIGYGALAQNNGASGGIAIGSSDSQENITTRTTAAQGNDIAFGVGAQTINRNMNGHNGGAIAIGHLSYSNGNQDVAIGDNAKTGRDGNNAGSPKRWDDGEGYVAIGANSFSNVGPGVIGYDPSEVKTKESGAIWVSTNGAVSVGNVSGDDSTKWITRQITGVAAGSADTDAVNVAQLKQAIAQSGGSSGGNSNHSTVTVGNNGVSEDKKTVQGGNLTLTLTKTTNGASNYDLSLNKDIDLGYKGSVKMGDTTINNDGVTITTKNGDNTNTISLTKDGLNNGGKTITHVGNGTDDNDAVNVSQLNAAKTTVTSNDHSVTITPDNNAADKHTNYDLKIATATLSPEKTGSGDSAVATGKVAVTNPKISVIENGETKQVDNPNAYVTGNDVANAINNAGFKLTTSQDGGGLATGITNTLIKPGDTVTIDAGKNISLAQTNGKISIATKDNLNLGSADSKDDKQQDVPGTDGSITVNGKNGSSVAINGQDGSIGLTGPKGKDGTSTSIQMSTILSTPTLDDGKNIKTTTGEGEQQTTTTQAPRIQYKNGNTTYEVATFDDGLKFAGDDGQNDDTKVITKKLNERLDIVGGAKGDLSDNNIGVTKDDNGKLSIRLAKKVDLDPEGSLKAGAATIGHFTNTELTTNKGKHPVDGSYTIGLGNTDWNVTDPEYVSGRAATEDQLKTISDEIKKTATTASQHTEITVNDKNNPTAVSNVGTDTYGDYAGTENDNLSIAAKKDTKSGKTIYNIKLNDQLAIGQKGTDGQAGKDGKDGKVTVETKGGTTVVVGHDGKDGDNGKDGLFVTGKNGKDGKSGVSITGPNGADGADGVDGKVGIAGKDGNDAVSISGKDGIGHIGLTGQKGADGKDGIFSDLSTILGTATLDPAKNEQSKSKDTVSADDKSSRIQYQTTVTDKDGKTKTVITHEVATMDDGMKYAGDFGDGASVKLNKTVNIKGNVAKDKTKDDFVDGNIAVVANQNGEDGELLIKLNKDLTGLNSATYKTSIKNGDVTTMSTTVVDGTGLKITNGPSITNTGIDGGSKKITNVDDGEINADSKEAINGSQLYKLSQTAGAHSTVSVGKTTATENNKEVEGGNLKLTRTQNGDKPYNYDVSLNNTLDLSKDGSLTIGNTVLNNAGLQIGSGTTGITIQTGTVNFGGNVIHNVAPGSASSDVATVGQLTQVEAGSANVTVNNIGTTSAPKYKVSVTNAIDPNDPNYGSIKVQGNDMDASYKNNNYGSTTQQYKNEYNIKQSADHSLHILGGYDLKGRITTDVAIQKTAALRQSRMMSLMALPTAAAAAVDTNFTNVDVAAYEAKYLSDKNLYVALDQTSDGVTGGLRLMMAKNPEFNEGTSANQAAVMSQVPYLKAGDNVNFTTSTNEKGQTVYTINAKVSGSSSDSNSDWHLVPAGGDDGYKVDASGKVTLKVQNGEDVAQQKDVTISNIATKDDLKNLKVEGKTSTFNVTANGKDSTTIEDKHTVNFKDGQNITATATPTDSGVDVRFDLKKDISVSSVTTDSMTAKTVTTDTLKVQNVTIDKNGIDAGGNKVTGVATGTVSKDSTDAVNGSQLWQRDQAINGLSGSVNKLGNRINRVGAGAAALAALHPLDFDPDDKWDFAAGYGNYRGANAAAIGAYYRPNEDTMFSVGGSFGGGENMVNAGVSIKLGQGNHVSTSRVAMAKEMKAMRQHMAEQDALIAKLQSMHGMAVDPAKSVLFPDVAENHWAYQYVTTLAKKGILEGYPDGEFKGDRMMTRYEFAAIVYRIVESGVGSTDPELSKLVKEFSPELQYIRIDTIQKDRNGKPTIERVRVISDAK